MNPLFIIGALGLGGYLLMSKGGGGGSNVAAAQQASASQFGGVNPAGQIGAQSNQFGGINPGPLTPADQANAASLGLSDQEYAEGMLPSTTTSGTVGSRFDPMSQKWYG
jgi:hypothetical protein